MEQKPDADINRRAFPQSLAILFISMIIAGLITMAIPAGQYIRKVEAGRQVIDSTSFHLIERPNYPIWRWFLAPIEVISSENGSTIIVLIINLFFIGGAVAVLDKTGILQTLIRRIIKRFSAQKYVLLWT